MWPNVLKVVLNLMKVTTVDLVCVCYSSFDIALGLGTRAFIHTCMQAGNSQVLIILCLPGLIAIIWNKTMLFCTIMSMCSL